MLRADRRTRIAITVAAIAQAGALGAAALGASAWPAVLLSAALLCAAVGRHYGFRLAIAVAVAASMLSVLFVLTATAALGIGMGVALAIATSAVAAAALVSIGRSSPSDPVPPTAVRLVPSLAASVGGLLVLGALAASQRLTANVRLDWVMRNDSPNNLTFARETLARGGIAVGGTENPAPIPSALVALTAAPGRDAVGAHALLEHDLSAMALTWAALIAVGCLLSGLVAAALVHRAGGSRAFVTFAALGGSLIVLSWYFTGYPMQFGFLNAHVALVVLLAGVLASLSSEKAPWLGFSVIVASGMLMLAVWSPLVVVPGGLALAVLITRWRALRAARGVRLAVPVVAVASLLAYGLAVALPVLLAQRDALGGSGGVFNAGNWVVFAVGAVTVGLAALAFRSFRAPEVIGVAAIVVSAWAGLGVLLFNSRYLDDPFTYYPVKFAWMSVLLFIIVALGLAIGFASRLRARSVLRIGSIAVIVAAIGATVGWVPSWGVRGEAQHPLAFIAVGNVPSGYPTLASYVLDFAGDQAPALLWRSGYPGEGAANIWIMQMEAGSLDSELRLLAFASYDDPQLAYLCRAAELMGPGLSVHTEDAGLERQIEAECPDTTAVFVVEEPRQIGQQ